MSSANGALLSQCRRQTQNITQDYNPSGLWGQVELCTPEWAQASLNKSAGNRSIRSARLAMYCRERRDGRWGLTHQGIAFGTDGRLYDGHHRCEMIVATGMDTPFFVFRNLDPTLAKFIDSGLPRCARDAFKMAGVGDYSNQLLSVARSYTAWPSGSHQATSRQHILDVIEEYAEALNFACEGLARHSAGVSRAVRGLVARAYWHVDKVRLQEWCAILNSGIPVDPNADCAAITYRNYLLRTCKNCGTQLEMDRYEKGQTMLESFLARKPATKCYGSEKDLYPLTGAMALDM